MGNCFFLLFNFFVNYLAVFCNSLCAIQDRLEPERKEVRKRKQQNVSLQKKSFISESPMLVEGSN